jgi:hypothetical protein
MQSVELIPGGDHLRPAIKDSLEQLPHFVEIIVPQKMKITGLAGALSQDVTGRNF